MEIHNHGKNLKIHFPVQQAAQDSGRAGELKGKNEVARTSPTTPQGLLDQLESGDAVRQQLLVEIQAKIHAGEYNTRVAAEQAAAQIVGF